ncbi:MAG: hypothetical protein JWQ61_1179 [Collimonas fungivorans]|uniref:hypothetical protein n=1 Tax=Collimonas fungivorans TaxID=158899 RepID=UPI0026EB870A|nr:hypothetical protein [Collimonas fungivorans]MDB5766365.1 hypothetical protein [Collimonas fungivorans]
MNEKKFALGAGLTGIAFIALLVYLTAPDMLPGPAVVLLPAGGVAARTADGAAPVKPGAAAGVTANTAAGCSAERLASWQLMSVGAGGYRQGGFAVLNNALRGSMTVAETQIFDGNLRLEKVVGNAVQLRCGDIVQTRVLADSHGAAAPEMRTALPNPATNN